MRSKKIDVLFKGYYVCSTNMSTTCREARRKFLDRMERMPANAIYINRKNFVITCGDFVKEPEKVKCFFDHTKGW